MKNMIPTRYITHWLLLVITSVLLSGCHRPNRPPTNPVTNQDKSQTQQQHQTQLAKLQQWQVQGKLVFKSPQDKFSVSLHWAQQPLRSTLRLTTFMGISKLHLVMDEQQSTLQLDGKTLTSSDPDDLLLKTTGIALPIHHLAQWIKGAAEEDPTQQIMVDGLNRLQQIRLFDGNGEPWQIDYQGYQTTYHNNESYQLPKIIKLSGNGVVATIKISQWTFDHD